MKTKLLFFGLFIAIINLQAQTTTVPDDNFENYLETHNSDGNTVALGDANSMGDGIANNNLVTTSKISGLIRLSIQSQNISDLTGIEDFTSLKVLYCDNNQLTTLDISQNITLEELSCTTNQLTTLNVSQNTNLAYLGCGSNQITNITFSANNSLSQLWIEHNSFTSIDTSLNSALSWLICEGNQLTNIDVTQNTALTVLTCQNNQLATLDVSQNSNLEDLRTYNNPLISLDVTQNSNLIKLNYKNNLLTNLDVSQNVALQDFDIAQNQLTNLEVSQNIALRYLFCHENQISNLDASQNIDLIVFQANDNPLNNLNIKNGFNNNIVYFNTLNTPNLTCIKVDNDTYSNTNWTNKDASSTFVETDATCATLSFEDNYLTMQAIIFPNPVKDQLTIKLDNSLDIKNIELTNLLGQEVLNTNKATIDVSNLAKGLYLAIINTNKGSIIKKIIKE